MTPGEFQHKIGKARQLLFARDFTKALPLYQKLVRQRPNDAVVWFEYGNAAAGARDGALADRAWRRAIDQAPQDAELILQVGHQYQGRRKLDQARACFARAAAADPRGIDPRISLAVSLERQHKIDDARAAVEACLSIDAHDDQARYLSAVLDRREDRLERAEQQLHDLIGSDPQHPYVRYACRYELAQLLDRRDEFDEAMKWLVEAKQMVRGLADVELLLQNYDREAEAARQFASNQPKDILAKWSKQFPEARREAIPPLTFWADIHAAAPRCSNRFSTLIRESRHWTSRQHSQT